MQRDAVDVADVLDGRPGPKVVDPEMAACAWRSHGDAPGVDHFRIDDLRMKAGLVGDENRLDEVVALLARGREAKGGDERGDEAGDEDNWFVHMRRALS